MATMGHGTARWEIAAADPALPAGIAACLRAPVNAAVAPPPSANRAQCAAERCPGRLSRQN
eukprot:4087370-Pyramimonas_sp.AAC.1